MPSLRSGPLIARRCRERLLALIDDELPAASALRRRLHACPSSGHRETATRRRSSRARSVPPPSRSSAPACSCASVRVRRPVVARAELDGLPIVERTGVDVRVRQRPHARVRPRRAHGGARGADRAARSGSATSVPAPFWALFQPSEEAHPLGAEMLVESGVLEGVRAVVAAHVHPGIPWGAVGADPGAVNAAADSLVFRITAQPGHGAYPHLGRDPILAMAEVVVGLHSLVGRRIDPLHPAVVNVGAVHAGEAANVIPPYADARATLRTLAADDRLTLREAAADADRGDLSRARLPGRDHDRARRAAARERSRDHAARVRMLLPRAGLELADAWRSCGSDDFSFFGANAPLLMAFVGLEGAPTASTSVRCTIRSSCRPRPPSRRSRGRSRCPTSERPQPRDARRCCRCPTRRARARHPRACSRSPSRRAPGNISSAPPGVMPSRRRACGDALDRLQVHAVQTQGVIRVADDHEPAPATVQRRRGSRRSGPRPSRAGGPADGVARSRDRRAARRSTDASPRRSACPR